MNFKIEVEGVDKTTRKRKKLVTSIWAMSRSQARQISDNLTQHYNFGNLFITSTKILKQ